MKLVLKSKLENNIHEISFKSFESYQNTKVDLSIQNLKQPITANLITEYEKINSLELEKFKQFLKRSNIQLVHIYSNSRETILSGKSLRIDSTLINKKDLMNDLFLNLSNKKRDILHKGTIRSGDRISSNGDLIVIGDVNPGAIVSAKKNVVALALVGAVVVTFAPKLSKLAVPKKNFKQKSSPQKFEKILIRVGYTFVGLSITLFIIAGFIVDLK